MNAVENDIRALVDKELAAANERFPQFHSAHEGWAVIREEVCELAVDAEAVAGHINDAWNLIMLNENPSCSIKQVRVRAINAACEAIQVAAMCKKFLEMEGKQYDN